MTTFLSLFILMLGVTMGLNLLAGAFQDSPAFEDVDDSVFSRIGTELPSDLTGDDGNPATTTPFNGTAGAPDCTDENVSGLIQDLCNPNRQTIETITETTVTGNDTETITSTQFTQQPADVGRGGSDLSGQITDPSNISIFSIDNVIAVLTGEFIMRAIGGAFFGFCDEVNDPSCDPDTQLPADFVNGFRAILVLMFAGMILSLLFGRSLSSAG